MSFTIWNQDNFNKIKNELQGSKPKRSRDLPTIHEVREVVRNHPYYSSVMTHSQDSNRMRSNSEPMPYLKGDVD